jgi:hypothetical protein
VAAPETPQGAEYRPQGHSVRVGDVARLLIQRGLDDREAAGWIAPAHGVHDDQQARCLEQGEGEVQGPDADVAGTVALLRS